MARKGNIGLGSGQKADRVVIDLIYNLCFLIYIAAKIDPMNRFLLLVILIFSLSSASFVLADTTTNGPVYIPNAFSPNGDGRNDRFEIFAPAGSSTEVISYAIYNRWGSLLFEQSNFTLPASESQWWDGTFRGTILPPDTYVYRVEVTVNGGESLLYTGAVAIVE